MPLRSALFSNTAVESGAHLYLLLDTGRNETGLSVLRSLYGGVQLCCRRLVRGGVDAQSPCSLQNVLERVQEAAKDANSDMIVCDCLHALRFATGVEDITAFVTRILDVGVSFAAVLPVIDGENEIAQLARMAHEIVLVAPLKSGEARDVHGVVQVRKKAGRWRRNVSDGIYRYHVQQNGTVSLVE